MKLITYSVLVIVLATGVLLWPNRVDAHCDTMDGPVARAGLAALDAGNLGPALRWVSAHQEAELRHVFETAIALRSRDKDVREVVDRYFLETLVRLHRATEGAPYTGLKPAGTPIAPAIHQAEQALAKGSASDLATYLAGRIEAGINQRLHRALDAAGHADNSVEQGREWVKAYVEFVHYVEAIDAAAAGAHAHDGQEDPAAPDARSKHADH